MKLILAIKAADELKPHLPTDTTFVRADIDGHLDGDAISKSTEKNVKSRNPVTSAKPGF